MAQIKQIGPGRKTTGTIDGVTYVTRNGITYARSTPTMPFSAYNTPAAKKRQAIFKFVQMHLKLHLRTIKQTFTPKGNGTATNRYYSLVEQAISDYAAEHPKSIKIASKSGYAEVYLTGPWPETITLNALTGDSTVIIIVAENGVTTTINADGTVTAGGENTNGSNTTNGETNTDHTDNTNTGGGSDSGGDTGGGDSGGSGGGSFDTGD